jgi:hypothetical protein
MKLKVPQKASPVNELLKARRLFCRESVNPFAWRRLDLPGRGWM